MARSLEGRVALVTGAGSGIGLATARRLAADGALVVVNDLKEEPAQAAVDAIAAAGGKAVVHAFDASDRDLFQGAIRAAAERHGRFDILVNNAAWVRYEEISTIAPKTLDRMLAIGFSAIVWGMQAAAEVMDRERGGSIVNIASVAGYLGLPRALAYCGIKAGVMGLTRSAATDLGKLNIRVNAVAPGSVETEAAMAKLTPQMWDGRRGRTPLGRIGRTEEIADVVAFLAGDDARFMSGEVVAVDGGLHRAFL